MNKMIANNSGGMSKTDSNADISKVMSNIIQKNKKHACRIRNVPLKSSQKLTY